MSPINRRNFLRGVGGLSLGLPFLESIVLRGVRAQAPPPIKRFIVFFSCNGANLSQFWPSNYGALTPGSFAASQALSPLADYADKLLIPRGIHMSPRGFGWDPSGGDDHMKGMGCKLTAQPLAAGGDTYAMGISVDQEMAKSINPGGRPPMTLRVGTNNNGVLGHISYTGSEQPASSENNPFLAYQDFVGLSNVDEALRTRITSRRESILDLVSEDFSQLKASGLSQADQNKLDMHFTAVREVEQGMGGAGLYTCNFDVDKDAELRAIDPNTVNYDSEFKRIGRLHSDVVALATACDYTRVASLQFGSGAGGPVFTWDGMNHQYNHHKLSHGTTLDDGGELVNGYETMIYDIDRWFAGEYRYLLDRLASYDEGGASVLDNSAVVWMNELSDGKDHDFRDLPYVIAGSCGGYFRTGEYLKVTSQADPRNDVDAPHNKLLTTFLDAVGARQQDGSPYTHFGNNLPDGTAQSGVYQQLLA